MYKGCIFVHVKQLKLKIMKRHESRNISRRRTLITALSPCVTYSYSGGRNPFDYLLSKFEAQFGKDSHEEKVFLHQLKMRTEKKSAIARGNRKRNKV